MAGLVLVPSPELLEVMGSDEGSDCHDDGKPSQLMPCWASTRTLNLGYYPCALLLETAVFVILGMLKLIGSSDFFCNNSACVVIWMYYVLNNASSTHTLFIN